MIIHSSKKDKNKRYKCKDCCKTFSQNTHTIKERIRDKNIEKFEQFVELFIQGITIENTSKILNISTKTAFKWRHRLLCLISIHKQEELQENKLNGNIEIDEKYWTVRRKGRNKVENPRKRVHSSSYSHSLKKRGLSREKFCLCTSVDQNNQYSFGILGFGKPSKNSLKNYAMENFNLSNSKVICDGDRVYFGAFKSLNVKYVVANSFHFPESNNENLNIQKINSLHSKMERGVMKDVNTCYIYRYLWFEIWKTKKDFHQLKNELIDLISRLRNDLKLKSKSKYLYWKN